MTFNAYMHDRNIYKNQLDLPQIVLDFPEFKKYVIPDAKGKKYRVDFTDTRAIRMLTKILLKKDFNLEVHIPEGFLIPTVPQRLNYILWLEDLMFNVSKKEHISGIDIGTGPCAIFSILGARKNGWKFVATESSEEAISCALKNVDENNLKDSIKVFKVNQGSALKEVLSSNNEHYDFCLCNPPFFDNIEEIRKKHKNSKETIADVAQKEEIFVKGGELDFVKNILRDSLIYKNRISLFTSMFGKKRSFLEIEKEVKEIKDAKYTTTEFCQGNTVRWGIAWTFDESIHLKKEVKKKVKPQKDKPPLEYQIPFKKPKIALDVLFKQTTDFLKTLQIPFTQTRVSTNFAELLLKSNKNTWTHQRRKRRELERQKKEGCNSETKSVDEVALNSKEDKAQEDIFLPLSPKSEAVSNDCSMDNKTVVPENNESKASDLLRVKNCSSDIRNTMLPHESTFSSNTDSSQNGKRKSLFSSEDLNKRKKELNTDEKITDICSEESTNQLDNSMFHATKSENTATSNDKHSTEELLIKEESVKSPASEDNGSSEISTNETDCNTMNTCGNPSAPIETENTDAGQDLILNCYLHFIKGKNKFYVKMNCPPTADRSTMHQVFQLLKNKIK